MEVFLARAKEKGVHNLLLIRGDSNINYEPMDGHDGFENGTDLLRFVKERFQDHFSCAVPGYPEGLVGSKGYDHDLRVLKQKVDAGAALVITQMFSDPSRYAASCGTAGRWHFRPHSSGHHADPRIQGLPRNVPALWLQCTILCAGFVRACEGQ